METEKRNSGYFQPVLLLLLTAAVTVGSIFCLKAAAGSFLKDENGAWADEINQAEPETVPVTEAVPETESETEKETQSEAVTETEAPAETETESQSEEVYLVLKVGCNFRAAPSMDAEIYETKEAGITVRFLEDVGGWYKVEIDGVVGYMGSQFF